MARSDPTDFVVQVLEGRLQGQVIPLQGRALPFRSGAGGSVSFGVSQRSTVTWYPGSQTGSHSITGPEIVPSTFNGVWDERYLGEDVPITLAEQFEGLAETGVQVRVLWSTLEYRGIVKAFDYKPGVPTGGIGAIAWSMTFEWNSKGAPPPPRRIGRSDISLRDGIARAGEALASLGSALASFSDGVETFVGSLQTSFEGTRVAVEGFIESLTPSISTLAQTASRMASETRIPAALTEDAIQASANGQAVSADAAEELATVFHGSVTPSDGFASVLNGYIDRLDVVGSAISSIRETWLERIRLEDLVRPESYAVVVPVPGSDLREYALRYYGDADLWPRIARQNGIETSLVPDDVEEIVIPLSLPDSTDDRVGGCSL